MGKIRILAAGILPALFAPTAFGQFKNFSPPPPSAPWASPPAAYPSPSAPTGYRPNAAMPTRPIVPSPRPDISRPVTAPRPTVPTRPTTWITPTPHPVVPAGSRGTVPTIRNGLNPGTRVGTVPPPPRTAILPSGRGSTTAVKNGDRLGNTVAGIPTGPRPTVPPSGRGSVSRPVGKTPVPTTRRPDTIGKVLGTRVPGEPTPTRPVPPSSGRGKLSQRNEGQRLGNKVPGIATGPRTGLLGGRGSVPGIKNGERPGARLASLLMGRKPGGPGGAVFKLDPGERFTLEGDLKAGKFSPDAAAAIRKAADGGVLTPAEIQAIKNDRDFNNKVGGVAQQAALSSLLSDQADKQNGLSALGGGGLGGLGGGGLGGLGGGGLGQPSGVVTLLGGLGGVCGTAGLTGSCLPLLPPSGVTPPYPDPSAIDPIAPPVDPGVSPIDPGVSPTDPTVVDPDPTTPTEPDAAPTGGTEEAAAAPAAGPETGMKIVEVLAGSAAQQADLRANDILVEVAGRRVRNWDDYQAAMAGATGPVAVVFYNAETKQLESLTVTPQGGLLGAAMEEATLPE